MEVIIAALIYFLCIAYGIYKTKTIYHVRTGSITLTLPKITKGVMTPPSTDDGIITVETSGEDVIFSPSLMTVDNRARLEYGDAITLVHTGYGWKRIDEENQNENGR